MISKAPELYRSLLRNAKNMKDYNFRTYAIRRVKADFQKNKNISGEELNAALQRGEEQLKVLQRQALLTNMYPSARSVMEV